MKNFLIRIAIFLPAVFFAVFVLFMVIGNIANALGAQDYFYCTIYCKLGAATMITAIVVVIFCQAKACWRK